jgi:hypothetical protein
VELYKELVDVMDFCFLLDPVFPFGAHPVFRKLTKIAGSRVSTYQIE